ncbi:MAG: ATP-binding cassette domain-containing protein [Pseudomonadales bacterium]|nr:ATP-binding cassette domain-containing protein [Pseudomonadales bacterium]
MPFFRLSDIHIAFGTQVLLDKVSLTIKSGDRIGLLGRNGAGKTTFLKLLSGAIQPDGGELWIRPGIKISRLAQELPTGEEQTVLEYVAGGLAGVGELLSEFYHLTTQAMDDEGLKKLERVQQEIEALGGWSLQQKVDSMISSLDLPAETLMASLSGGWSRRVAMARALVSEPDVLLLDEPTNHLDIPTINWLEKHLQDFRGAIVVITHDRAFLQKIANQIIELDRGRLYCWHYDYRRFLVFREQQLAAEEKTNSEFDKRLAQEEIWIRQGIKARRTRNEGRVRALEKMRAEYSARRKVLGNARISVSSADQSGRIVVEAEHVSHSFDGVPVICDFSLTILRGDKIGLIGPNGAGKTTLLKILLGQLEPENGRIKIGSKLELAYFDQLRAQLHPEQTVLENLAQAGEYIDVKGKPRHVISYLQDFLFTPERIRQPVKSLSGGEQNRLILARLFSKSANLLVLDEPTNDLDMETLELLEEILLDFDGTVLLVSHDRAFLDNVVTSSIVFEGQGRVKHYVGGYQDWLDKGGQFIGLGAGNTGSDSRASAAKVAPVQEKPVPKTRLSFKLQRELEQLPALIEKAEQTINALEQQIAAPDFYRQERSRTDSVLQQLAQAQQEQEDLFGRWESIEQQQQ